MIGFQQKGGYVMLKQQIAIYARLSLEDIDKRSNKVKDESNSIASQRLYINRHLDQNPLLCDLPRIEFSDDGFSGTNFDRPDFSRMIDLIKRGEVSCVIVKDLSRFGRDYLEVGDYLEHLFPFLGVRFISINDHYDSVRHGGTTIGTDIAFKNLLYDYYCKDLSIKVKSAMVVRQKECRLVNCVPYGYQPSSVDKHQLVIDQPAATIVRRIFLSIIAGKSPTEIARELNNEQVPSPSLYKALKKPNKTIEKKHQWTHRTIHTIINNIKYVGTMVNHTRESRHLRDKNQRRVPVEEWTVKKNAHEGIVSEEEYEQAHNAIKRRKPSDKIVRDRLDRVYYCGHCGRKLEKANGTVFACPSHRYHDHTPCSQVYLRKSEIEEVVYQLYLKRIKEAPDASKPIHAEKQDNPPIISLDTTRLQKQLGAIKADKLSLYEQYKAETLSADEYLRRKNLLALKEDQINKLLDETVAQTKQHTSSALVQSASDEDPAPYVSMYGTIERIIVNTPTDIKIEWKSAEQFDNQINIAYNR